jgi:hypothetical protein
METLEKKKVNGNGNGNGKALLTDVKEIRGKNGVKLVKLGDPIPTDETKTEVKSEEKTQETAVLNPLKKELTLDQKIEKVENLKILIEKREKLEESRKKLSSFVIGSHQFSEKIVLSDDRGNSFNTSNSEVFAKVVGTINETLITKISEIEKQIEF